MIYQILLGVALIGLGIWYWRLISRMGAKPVSWFILPMVGAIDLVINRFRVHEYSREWLDKQPDMKACCLVMPGIPSEVICTLAFTAPNVKYILKDNFANFPKGPIWQERLGEVLGTGIFNADGAHWKLQRKTASHMFSRKNLRGFMLPIFFKHAHKAVSILFRKMKNNANASKSLQWDMQHLMNCFTIDSIGHILFGKDIDSLNNDSVFANAFDLAQQCAALRFVTPGWQIIRFFAGFLADRTVSEIPPTDAETLNPLQIEIKMIESVKVIRNYAEDIIEHKREILKKEEEAGNEAGSEHQDLLIKFMRDNVELTNTQLVDVVLNFMIAGRDTTSNCLAWSMYYISQHPEVEKRIVEEASKAGLTTWSLIDKDKLGNLDSTHLVSSTEASRLWDIQNELPYAEAVVMETLRMRPSVPLDLKWVLEDDVLPDGNICVKKGTFVAFYPYVMGLSDKNWKDPLSYRPERWLERDESDKNAKVNLPGLWKKKKTSYEYPVFQAGPRTCLGMDMAILEAKLCLSILISSLKFRYTGTEEPKAKLSLTIPMQQPLMMEVTER